MSRRLKYTLLAALAGACALTVALLLTRQQQRQGPAGAGCLAQKLPGETRELCFSSRPVRIFTPTAGVARPEFTRQGYKKPILLVGEPENRLREFADAVERSPRAKFTTVDDDVSIHFPSMDRRRGGRIINLGAGLAPTLHYFTGLVGPNGRYLMVDVDPRIIDFLEYRVSREDEHHRDRERVVLIQNRMDDPCLPRGWADLVFLRNIHYWVTRLPDDAGPRELRRFWSAVAGAVAPGGRLVVVENHSFRDGLTLKSQLKLIGSMGLLQVALGSSSRQGNWVAVFQSKSAEASDDVSQ